ncbi:50S ribosomal protein L1 [Candidatus Uhrbacteria bacterium]|nr:50S ribosomal protein L1 [Candidatus Uhrbacteria bacterium]
MQKKVRGKKYLGAQKLIDAKKLYAPAEAMELAKKTATTKFDSSIEVHMHLGIDPKKGEQAVRGVVVMPHATGQTKRVAVFTVTHADVAKKAGADLVGGKELIAEIKSSGKCDFDVAVADPSMMKDIAVIAKVLGPKGLMPSPKNETVTNKIEQTVMELKRGKVTFKNDDSANVHQSVGKASLDAQKLAENLIAFIDAVKKAKPASAKGAYIENIVVCSTMGPGIKVSV